MRDQGVGVGSKKIAQQGRRRFDARSVLASTWGRQSVENAAGDFFQQTLE